MGSLEIISKKEQRSAILAEYQSRDVSPNRVPWKEYVLAVSTFPDRLQGPTRTRKMGQNVLAKQSASRLVSAHVWTSLMIFIANSRTNLAHAQTVDTRPFSFPPRKGTGYEARLKLDRKGFLGNSINVRGALLLSGGGGGKIQKRGSE